MPKRERGSGGLLKVKGSRFYYGQYYKDGRQIRVSLKTDIKTKAQASLRRLMGDSERGIRPESEIKKLRYVDLRTGLLANYLERGNKSLQTLNDGSETIWGLKALDEFFKFDDDKGVPIGQITTDAARKFVRERLDEGLSNDTVNGSLRLLRRMLNIAVEDGKLTAVPKIRLLKSSKARQGFVARETFDLLIGKLPVKLKPIITFLYYCAVRLGEAKQIEWSQVDLDSALIRLEQDQTKNGLARIIPIPDVVVEMLRNVPAKTRKGPIFFTTNLRKEWQKACVAAGLGTFTEVDGRPDKVYAGLIIHDLRRSAISNMMRVGASESEAMKISGHRTNDVFKRYHIVSTADSTDLMRRVQAAQKLVANSDSLVVRAALPSAL